MLLVVTVVAVFGGGRSRDGHRCCIVILDDWIIVTPAPQRKQVWRGGHGWYPVTACLSNGEAIWASSRTHWKGVDGTRTIFYNIIIVL